MQGASSSSGFLILAPRTHDVFLSFRGEDTRWGFTYHLYNALERKNIKTFFDDRKLKKGENISAALLQAIEVSKISVVICSENYGSSSWCLDELVKILECQESKQQIVIPVFYKVDPSDVRRQKGSFGKAFDDELKNNQDKIPKWRAALTQLANLSGCTYQNGYESDFIDKIVEEILDVPGLNHQSNDKHFTGLVEQKKNINGADLHIQPPPPPPPPLKPLENRKPMIVKHPFGQLESICPPGGIDKVVLYTTSIRAVLKTYQACNDLRAALTNQGVMFSERDVSWEHEGYLKELRELMIGKGKEATVPPRLFVKGKYVGGCEEVFKLLEEGWFRQVLQHNTLSANSCKDCGETGFQQCSHCQGKGAVICMSCRSN